MSVDITYYVGSPEDVQKLKEDILKVHFIYQGMDSEVMKSIDRIAKTTSGAQVLHLMNHILWLYEHSTSEFKEYVERNQKNDSVVKLQKIREIVGSLSGPC